MLDLGTSAQSDLSMSRSPDVALLRDVGRSAFDGSLVERDMMGSSPDGMMTKDAFQPRDSALVIMTDMQEMELDAGWGEPKCSSREEVDMCLFGRTSRILESQPFLSVTLEARHRTFEALSALEGEQLLFGFLCDDIFSPDSPEAAFNLLDMDGLRIFRVVHTETDTAYTWLKFYMGDTEVGYLYAESTMTMVAIVSDQDIYRCQVSR